MSERLGLLIAAAIAVAAAIVAGVFITPTSVVGRVVSLPGQAETDMGSYPVARVQIANGEVTVVLPRDHTCAPGSPIHPSRRRYPWGFTYASPSQPCVLSAGG